jgi:hypothetical protein
MAEAKDIIPKLEECIKIALTLDEHHKKLVNIVAMLEPSHNVMKAMLKDVGFGNETTNEDNLRLLLDHHKDLVVENTGLRNKLNDQESLMEQLRKVVLKSVD